MSYINKLWLRRVILSLVILLGIAFLLPIVTSSFQNNVAYIALSKALASNQIRATQRQNLIHTYLRNTEQNLEIQPARVQLTSSSPDPSMIRSIFIGQYYRYHGDLYSATQWFEQALSSPPVPEVQSSLAYAARDRLNKHGDIVLESFETMQAWTRSSGSQPIDGLEEVSDGGLTNIRYQNNRDQRDLLAYSLFPNFYRTPLGYHSTLKVKAKVDVGAYLSIESVIDGTRERHLNYYVGNGEWDIFRFPLDGNVLTEVKLIFHEPNLDVSTDEYSIWLDVIELELEIPQ